MSGLNRLKLLVLILFVLTGAALFTNNAVNRRVHAFSAGPPAGYTRAPGEEPEACAECHLADGLGTGAGTISIDAPQTYVPGQVYQITVTHTNSDLTRVRWGFQLTALDTSEERAGSLEPLDGYTQVLSGQGPFPDRQYIEHTQPGTFFGQTGGASWAFRWTAPATDVGPVTFYAAGNHANGDQNSSGDNIYFTFVSATPAAPSPDFSISVTPSTRIVTPGESVTYDVTVTPFAGFTGTVNLSLTTPPPNTTSSFNPPSLNISDASAQTSVLTLTALGGVTSPVGSSRFNVNATSGALQHSAQATLINAAPESTELAVTMTDSPDPVPLRANLSYRITVTNNGPGAATGVTLTDTLPASASFVSATPTQGSCSGTTTVTCALGDLAAGASAVVNIVVQPQAIGHINNTASVSGAQGDPYFANNTVSISTTVEQQGSTPLMLVPNLSVRTIVSGLDQPTGLAFLAANDFLVLEKATGRVRRVVNGGVQATVLDLSVNSASERGLLGVALHPNFAANKFVYLYWTESPTGDDTTDTAAVFLLGNRVDRYVWNGSTLIFDRNLIRLRAHQEDEGQPLRGNHNGGRLAFGPDGKLYIMIGDVGRRGFLQNVTTAVGPAGKDDPWGGPEPDDAHLTGVVLRLNDDGTTPTDNPFFNVATGLTTPTAADNVKKVFAYGVRNGFGMAFDPLGGKLWTQEHGDDAFDEINRVEAGSNGGWIQLMGPLSRVSEYKSIELARAGGLQQLRWPPSLIADTPQQALQRLYQLPGSTYTDPQLSWKYAVAPSPLGFVAGQGLGPQYAGDMFLGASRTTLLGGYLFRLKLSADRLRLATTDARLADGVADNADKFDLTESESLVAGRDFGITTDIQTGPDGNLYVVSLSNGAVYEIFARSELFVANLTGAQEVPPNNSAATGTATLTLATDGATARITLDFDGLSSQQTDAHVHGPAAPGASAGILFDLPDGDFSDFQITLTPQQVAELRAGRLYVNVHSQNFPGGEIRGQFGGPTSAPTSANPIDDPAFFVRQHYYDFLNRAPDASGLAFWKNQITECETRPEAERQGCREVRRINVSAAFFLSIEFQETGYYVLRTQRAAFGRRSDTAPLRLAYAEFVRDARQVGEGVVVGQAGVEQLLEQNKQAYAEAVVGAAGFAARFPLTLGAAEYVDALFASAGVAPTPAERQEAIDAFGAGASAGRVSALRKAADSGSLRRAELNPAFVLLEYYGYLRRNPTDAPDTDDSGYQFWLAKLNSFGGNYIAAEMVKAFITSSEYRARFGN
ncbi:MAG TPA: PQQ-dependent sugar dehydrogenase [Pyrinomonadaceae bacterium]